MPFPSDRFQRAGATAEQLESLEAEYNELTPDGQASRDAHIVTLSDGAIAEEYLQDAPEGPEPDPTPSSSPDPEVAASSSPTSSPSGGSASPAPSASAPASSSDGTEE